jgi:DNA-binding transcriptional MerR regulator
MKKDLAKFLISAFNMVKRGDIKSEQDLIKFAKQQFGELHSNLLSQIKNVFKEGQAAAVTETRTKDIMRERRGLASFQEKMEELKKNLQDLKDLDKQETKINEELMDAMMGFKKPTGSKDRTKPFQTPGMPYKKENPGYRTPGGSMYAEGNLRTAMREFLKTEVKEGRLKLNEQDLFRITEYSPLSADDPIDVFRRYYGEDALEAADAMASKLEKGTSFKNYEEIFRANMPELKIKTEGAGQYDQSIIDAEAAMKQAAEDEKNLQKLEEFDVEGRTKNSKGGINRVGFAKGKIKLAQFLYGKGTDLITEIRKAVNNITESGDKKVDADVAVDDMFDELGIDRDTVDQKDILEAYDEAYKTLSIPPGSRGGPEDIAEPFQSAEESTGNLISKQLKTMRLSEDIQPGLFEKLSDKQREIIETYGDLIDRELLKNIVLDPDPNNQAAAIATLEQVKTMGDKGMSIDEIMNVLQSTPRRKQAEGGLSYLMGM